MYIQTKRLMIRPFVKADIKQFERLLTIKELPGWIQQHILNYQKMDVVKGTVCFGIFDQTTGEVLGAENL